MNDDFLDLLSALSDANARFLVVGGYAVGVHGHPRATKDLDVWVEASPDNAARVMDALEAFVSPVGDLSVDDLATPVTGFMMGRPPSRIDILTKIAGDFEGIEFPVISLEDLILNKQMAGRPQGLADVAVLTKIRDGGD
jgi:hypothetical protein